MYVRCCNATRGDTRPFRTFRDSPNHNVYVVDCNQTRIRNMSVYAPHNSKNTDGVNFAGGHDQLIENSHISNGDDCVSVVTSSGTLSAGGALPSDGGVGVGQSAVGGSVVIRNLHCVGGHGAATSCLTRFSPFIGFSPPCTPRVV